MIKNLYKKTLFFLHNKLLPEATQREQKFTEILLRSVQQLPHEDVSGCLPSEKQWKENVSRLGRSILTADPREFLRWDVLTETMVVNNSDFILTELKHLQQDPGWHERWRKAIQEITVGHPKPFPKYPLSSANLIHHAYHIAQFEKRTGTRINELDGVVEFGAGYGSMCRLFHNLGYSGTYIMYDLPIVTELQKYYLQSMGISIYSDGSSHAEVTAACISNFDTLKELLSGDNVTGNTLFLALWSISEVPLVLREQIFSLVSGFSFFLIGYQNQFCEVDNVEYFDNLTKQLSSTFVWSNYELEHLPGNHFLIGVRR